MRVGEAERLHRTVTQGLGSAFGHHLDGKATVEVRRRRLPLVKAGLVAGEQFANKNLILLARQRAVDVIRARSTGSGLVVARLKPRLFQVNAVAMDNRCNGIEKSKLPFARPASDCSGESGRGERACRDDDVAPIIGRRGNLSALERDQGVSAERG